MKVRTSALALLLLGAAVACGSSSSAPTGTTGPADGSGVSGGGDTTDTTVSSGDGGSSSGTTTTTASDGATVTLEEHTRDVINAYRKDAGTAPLTLDDALNKFAVAGSTELSQDHEAHGHFIAASNDGSLFSQGFMGSAAENEGDPDGDSFDGSPAGESAEIDSILKDMFDEGPGGGHHDNMLDPKSTRLGVGLVISGGGLYFTNDFSP